MLGVQVGPGVMPKEVAVADQGFGRYMVDDGSWGMVGVIGSPAAFQGEGAQGWVMVAML